MQANARGMGLKKIFSPKSSQWVSIYRLRDYSLNSRRRILPSRAAPGRLPAMPRKPFEKNFGLG
jgi:hypothetical protein